MVVEERMISVLLIDRDVGRVAAAADLLARGGYCPPTAGGDGEALILLRQAPVQAVLAADRSDLVETIRRQFPTVPVVSLRAELAPARVLDAVGRCLPRDLAA
jgi:hypothetical protein